MVWRRRLAVTHGVVHLTVYYKTPLYFLQVCRCKLTILNILLVLWGKPTKRWLEDHRYAEGEHKPHLQKALRLVYVHVCQSSKRVGQQKNALPIRCYYDGTRVSVFGMHVNVLLVFVDDDEIEERKEKKKKKKEEEEEEEEKKKINNQIYTTSFLPPIFFY